MKFGKLHITLLIKAELLFDVSERTRLRRKEQLQKRLQVVRPVVERRRRQQDHLPAKADVRKHPIVFRSLVAEVVRLVHDNHVEIVIDLQHLHNLVKFAAATDFPVVELELALVFVPTAAQSRPVAHQPGRTDDQSAAATHRTDQTRDD